MATPDDYRSQKKGSFRNKNDGRTQKGPRDERPRHSYPKDVTKTVPTRLVFMQANRLIFAGFYRRLFLKSEYILFQTFLQCCIQIWAKNPRFSGTRSALFVLITKMNIIQNNFHVKRSEKKNEGRRKIARAQNEKN
ncbi:hypothetical protein [Treponema saccharophilum]|uniref:hypothetical protein n=1 Tax=Treponema saccharophilum TaxID=165 RepID=UPI003863B8CD